MLSFFVHLTFAFYCLVCYQFAVIIFEKPRGFPNIILENEELYFVQAFYNTLQYINKWAWWSTRLEIYPVKFRRLTPHGSISCNDSYSI